jgi:tetratricopeptide (TPR) repeat protein
MSHLALRGCFPFQIDMTMTRRNPITTLALLLSAALSSSAQAADTITRKRDKPVSGEISGMSKTDVTIKVTTPKADTIKVNSNDIASIAWNGEPPECNVARKDEEGGRYQKAIDGYQKALQSGKATSPHFKTDLEFGIARASGKLGLVDSSRLDDAVKKLEDFQKKQGDNYRFYDSVNLLGQLHAARKDFVKAKQAFDTLGKAPWKDYQMAAKIASGRLALAENKLDDAAADYDAVVAMTAEGQVEESQRQEAVLGKARIMIIQKKFDDALKLLKEVIEKAPPEDVKVNAEAFLRQGDCLREQGSDSDALLSYLLVDVQFFSEKALHAEALYRLANLWEKTGNKPRADEARERLKSDYESSEWTRQLKAPTTN